MRSKPNILKFLLRILLWFLRGITSFFPYVYVLRFPLLTWVLMVSLPFLAFYGGARSIVANLFDVTEKGMFAVSLAAFNTSWTIMLTATLILMYSDARFGFDTGRAADKPRLFRWRYTLPFFCLSAVPMIWAAFRISGVFTFGRLFYSVLGLLVSLILLLLAYVAQLWLVNPKVLKESPTLVNPYVREILGVPENISELDRGQHKTRRTRGQRKSNSKSSGNIFERFFAYLATRNPFKHASDRLRILFKNVPPKFGEGYFKYDQNERVEAVLPNHGFAISLFLMSLIMYFFIGYLKSFRFGLAPNFPTLAYVLLLVMMLCWGLSGLSFFFDRYRIPVAMLLALWLGITSFFPSDHLYHLRDQRPNTMTLTPAHMITNRKPSALIVVAANGGGIQAAAWAARVLTGLVEQCRKEFNTDGREFTRSIYLISGASGGSVGSMYFVNAYTKDGFPTDQTAVDKIVREAERSSLDDVAWGLAFPDFQRALFPFVQRTDRGEALEKALARDSVLGDALLTDWRADVSTGWRPATVFNATISETGEPLLLGTVEIKASESDQLRFNGKNLGEYYPGKDVSVATAARLSASFPYVSPAVRADDPGSLDNRLHVVDGGYYDNYGMSTLVEWLAQALKTPDNQIRHVLVIQIRGAASNSFGDREHLGRNKGWSYQTYAPLSTLLNLLFRGQLSHNNIELDSTQRALSREHDVVFENAIFEYNTADVPLSWHLTAQQKDNIRAGWELQKDGNDWAKVRDFVKNNLLPQIPQQQQGQ